MENVNEQDIMDSSSISSRLSDLHAAFLNKNVKAIFTVLGGYNSNQLLEEIDYDLIKKNPKIFCGFSDITALSNAIYHKTGLVNYSGMHFSSFAMQKGFEYSLEYFKKIFFNFSEISLLPSQEWSDDAWYLDQKKRIFHSNSGYQIYNSGKAKGKILGGNLKTLRLLCGTPYMPALDNTILFIEEATTSSSSDIYEFDSNLQALTQDPSFKNVRGIVIGRFERSFGITDEKLRYILSSKPILKNIPIIANADFGHTTPIFTFPIGGVCSLQADEKVQLIIENH